LRKALLALTLSLFTSGAFAGELSQEEILKKLRELEAKVEKLEAENRELKELLKFKGAAVRPARKEDRSLKVGGRVLFRFSQTQDLTEAGGKSIYGDPGNGFTVRKARLFTSGKIGEDFKFKVQVRADRGAPLELWDAYGVYSHPSLPLELKFGQFKVPLSMSYLKSGTKLALPERPLAVNKIAPVWRDLGVEVTYRLAKGLKLSGAVINGEGWSSSKIYNSDRHYAYVLAVDAKLLNTPSYSLRGRLGYETGTDSSSKLVYAKYGAVRVKRHLVDAEASLVLKDLGLTLEGGYLFDNPTDAKDSSGKELSLGNAKGYYLQADYALPLVNKLHLVARYSYLDPNTDKDDALDLSYTTLGAYYLINGWQTAIRTSYTFANERKSEEVDNDLFTAELQLLF